LATDSDAAQTNQEHELSAELAHELDVPALHRTLDVDEPLRTLDVGKRILGLKLLTYNEVVDSKYGPIMFEPGAFGEVDPPDIRLRMDHEDPPTGRGLSFKDTPLAPFMDFKVSQTARGNDQLTLAVDGVSRGASVGFDDIPGVPKVRTLFGKRVLVYPPDSARLAEVSTTWQPTFSEAGVMYVLHKEEKGSGPMAEQPQEAAAIAAPVDVAPIVDAIQKGFAEGKSAAKLEDAADKMLGFVEQFKELQRAGFAVPKAETPKPKFKDWFGVTLRKLAGEHISESELKTLALDDIVTSDNPGLVPDSFTPDLDDVIDRDRPFLNSTREVRPPSTGNAMTLPIITQRAVAGTQYGGEKTEVTVTGPRVGTGTFTAKSILAGADISIQMILRADRSFLDTLDEEFAEAYALDEEIKAIAALLAGYTDSASVSHQVQTGGVMDPENPEFGTAFKNSVAACRRRPTHLWLSVDGMAAFIDAKAPVTNAPLYSNLAASITAGGGAGGTVSGLIPVYVPALDTSGVDVIIGPSRGFVWAEDPRIRLQADNPGLAGRDIVLAGTLFPAPRYADAFTTYTVAS
jgi:phage head maturation protease